MTGSEILRLASEMDSLADEAADVLYVEVRRRNLEEAVAGEAAEVPLPDETEGLVPSADDDSLRNTGFFWRFGTLVDLFIVRPAAVGLGAFVLLVLAVLVLERSC
jgi:hypothetical protein